MRLIICSTLSFLFLACAHVKNPAKNDGYTSWLLESDSLKVWVNYVNELEQMSSRDLKQEVERQRKAQGDSDGELRFCLAQATLLAEGHSFQKAAESLQAASLRHSMEAETRLWLKQQSRNLQQLATLEKDLLEEKRIRTELEKKMKALSDIEIEMRQRDKSRVIR